MTGTFSVAIPCRADEPGLETTLESLSVACQHHKLPAGLIIELIICINSVQPGAVCVPLYAARHFCATHGVLLKEVWLDPGGQPSQKVPHFLLEKKELVCEQRKDLEHSVIPRCTILLTTKKGKPPAWNLLWRWTIGEVVLFSDADVRIDPEAVFFLYARLRQDAALCLVAAREVPVLKGGGTLWSRMGAIPYRFNFGNAGGRLLLIRKGVLQDGIPEDLLLEDAWLTVAVGRNRVAKEPQAQVFFLLPATGYDYFAERVRTEGGKLQIRRTYRELLAAGPIARYRWTQFWRQIALKEYPLVMLALALRGLARMWARVALTRKNFYSLYRPFSSTKEWGSRRG